MRFTHRWGGAIDTSSRFSVFFGRAFGGKLSYATGYTGLGVAAARFGGRTALDLLDGRDTEATRLRYVRKKPVPFPPEPLRYAVVQYTRHQLAAADGNQGRRGPGCVCSIGSGSASTPSVLSRYSFARSVDGVGRRSQPAPCRCARLPGFPKRQASRGERFRDRSRVQLERFALRATETAGDRFWSILSGVALLEQSRTVELARSRVCRIPPHRG